MLSGGVDVRAPVATCLTAEAVAAAALDAPHAVLQTLGLAVIPLSLLIIIYWHYLWLPLASPLLSSPLLSPPSVPFIAFLNNFYK